MTTRKSRLIAFTCAIAAIAACAVNLSFDMAKDLAVEAAGTSLATTVPVDLSQYSEVQSHKGNVQDLSLQSIDATVTTVEAANHATSLSGAVTLRPDGAPADGSQDIAVGSVQGLAISPGATFHLPGNPQVDAFLLQALKGTGKFSLVVAGSTAGGEAHLQLHVVMHVGLVDGVF